jgi:hypothetical protein
MRESAEVRGPMDSLDRSACYSLATKLHGRRPGRMGYSSISEPTGIPSPWTIVLGASSIRKFKGCGERIVTLQAMGLLVQFTNNPSAGELR